MLVSEEQKRPRNELSCIQNVFSCSCCSCCSCLVFLNGVFLQLTQNHFFFHFFLLQPRRTPSIYICRMARIV